MPTGLILLLALVVGGLIIAVAVGLERRRLEQLAGAFEGGVRVSGLFPPCITARHDGFGVSYRVVRHQQRHRHGGFHRTRTHGHSVLVISAKGGPTWTAAPEGLGTSLLKGLGVMSDISLGIEDLDRDLRFTAKAPRRLPDMLVRPAAQDALRTLAAHPRFAGLRCDDSRLEARYTIDPDDVDAEYDPAELRRRLGDLVAVAHATGARPTGLQG